MPKLPADLPENWTQGQTISPNGTETGLTEQHGYNYLMKQVNNTQTEVNNINGALPDVAQQATVEKINNKIGTESDADTQPTLFGRLAQLKNVLLEKLAQLLTKVTGIDGKIGTSGDTLEDETLFGKLAKVLKLTGSDSIILVPSDNLKITVLDNEEFSVDGNTAERIFLGYVRFSKTGFVRAKVTSKSGLNGSDAQTYLNFFDAVHSGTTHRSSIENLPVKGDTTRGSLTFGQTYVSCMIGEVDSTNYKTSIFHPYVVKDQLYAVIFSASREGGKVKDVKFYYDEVESRGYYDSMP